MLPGMPEKISAKPRIAIVGAGNLASALAVSLRGAGYEIEQIIARGQPSSMRRARTLAREVGASAVSTAHAQIQVPIVWFCVPDGAIAGAAESLAEAANWSGKIALHSSGALTGDELSALRRRGASVASVHPLMTFVRGSRPSLVDVPFAIEGDRKAMRSARAIVLNLRGKPFTIRKRHKAAYHAWGTFASPLLTALLVTAEHVATAAGLKRESARQRMLPIIRQTLANYAALGGAEAFSGPIIRGDLETVKCHLRVLREIPVARDVYVALAMAALDYLPIKKKSPLERVLAARSR
jgi:predicted short-subunit dehydrogenase-like oxidoreductase (DUF2520 family)